MNASMRVISYSCKRLGGLLAPLVLVFSVALASAASVDDEYLRIFNGIQEADTIAKSGKTEQALTKYRELFNTLNAFKKEHPEWDPQVVNFRVSYLTQRVRTLTDELDKAPSTGTNAAAAAQRPAGAGAAQVKLLDPGAEPRAALRLHPAPGDKQVTTMKILMAMQMKMGDMEAPIPKMPEFGLTMETTTTGSSPDGDIQFDFAFTSVEVTETPETAQVVQAMRQSLDAIKGISGKGTLSSRGEPKAMTFDRPPSATSPALQGLTQAEEFFSSMGVIFPEEPIGKGAKWEVRRPVKSQGMTINQTADYEITALEGETVTLNSNMKQSAANQKMPMPGQPGMNMTLDKMTGSGTGTSTYELSRLMATKGSAKAHSDLTTSVPVQGQKQQITMKMDFTVKVEGK